MKSYLGVRYRQHTFPEVRSTPQKPAPVLSPRLQALSRLRSTDCFDLFWASVPCLLCDLEDDFEFYRHPEGKAGNADYQPNRCFLDPKNISKQVRDGVGDLGLVEEVPGGCYEHSKPDDSSHSIE